MLYFWSKGNDKPLWGVDLNSWTTEYMDLTAGTPMKEIPVDGKFIVVLPEKTMIAPPAWDISSRP